MVQGQRCLNCPPLRGRRACPLDVGLHSQHLRLVLTVHSFVLCFYIRPLDCNFNDLLTGINDTHLCNLCGLSSILSCGPRARDVKISKSALLKLKCIHFTDAVFGPNIFNTMPVCVCFLTLWFHGHDALHILVSTESFVRQTRAPLGPFV